MAKALYTGVEGIARKVKKVYVGVDGVARKVKKIYIGDSNGIARATWGGIPKAIKVSVTGTVKEITSPTTFTDVLLPKVPGVINTICHAEEINTLFVATTYNSAYQLYKSEDEGNTFQYVSVLPAQANYSMFYGNEVLGFSNYTGVYFASAPFTTWTLSPYLSRGQDKSFLYSGVELVNSPYNIAFGNGVFVALVYHTSASNFVAYWSTDCNTWTASTIGESVHLPNRIIFAKVKKIFKAFYRQYEDDYRITTSTDGKAFYSGSTAADKDDSNRFMVAGDYFMTASSNSEWSDTTYRLNMDASPLYSGLTTSTIWNSTCLPLWNYNTEEFLLFDGYYSLYTTTVALKGMPQLTGERSPFPIGTYSGNAYATNSLGSIRYIIQKNGLLVKVNVDTHEITRLNELYYGYWSNTANMGLNDAVRPDVISWKGKYIYGNASSSWPMVSDDGESFKPLNTLPLSTYGNYYAWYISEANNRVFFTGPVDYTKKNEVGYYSDDLETFTQFSFPLTFTTSTKTTKGVGYINGKYLFFQDVTTLPTTTDFSTYTTMGSYSSLSLTRALLQTPTVLYAEAQQSNDTSLVLQTTNGTTWTSFLSTNGEATNFQMAYGNGTYVVVGDNKETATYSTAYKTAIVWYKKEEATSWTKVELYPLRSPNIIFTNGAFIVTSMHPGNDTQYYYSYDGATWTNVAGTDMTGMLCTLKE